MAHCRRGNRDESFQAHISCSVPLHFRRRNLPAAPTKKGAWREEMELFWGFHVSGRTSTRGPRQRAALGCSNGPTSTFLSYPPTQFHNASSTLSVYYSTAMTEGMGPPSEPALFELVYHQLRRLASSYMRHERPDHTLQTSALVNEAYVRLASNRHLQP